MCGARSSVNWGRGWWKAGGSRVGWPGREPETKLALILLQQARRMQSGRQWGLVEASGWAADSQGPERAGGAAAGRVVPGKLQRGGPARAREAGWTQRGCRLSSAGRSVAGLSATTGRWGRQSGLFRRSHACPKPCTRPAGWGAGSMVCVSGVQQRECSSASAALCSEAESS